MKCRRQWTGALVVLASAVAVAQAQPAEVECSAGSEWYKLHPYLRQCVVGVSVHVTYRRTVGVAIPGERLLYTHTASGLTGRPVTCEMQAAQQVQQHTYTEREVKEYELDATIGHKGAAAVEAGIQFLVDAVAKVGIETSFVLSGRWSREATTERSQFLRYTFMCCYTQDWLLYETNTHVTGTVAEDRHYTWDLGGDPCWGGTTTTVCENAEIFPGRAERVTGTRVEPIIRPVCEGAGPVNSCCWCELCP